MPVALRSLSRKPKAPTPPENDPRYVKVMAQLKQNVSKVKQHPTPAKKAAEAQAAAKGPPNEKAAGAKAKQVDKIKDAKTKKPEPSSFLELLRAEIQKALPKTLGDTEKFMKGGDAGSMKNSLKGNVAQQKQAATGDTAQASKQAPSEAGVPSKQEQPIPGEAPPPNPDVPAGEAMPAPKPDTEVSVQDSKQDTEAAMADAEVTDTQLKKANDPRFSAVLDAKGQVAKQADAAPGQYRSIEKGTLAAAATQAKSVSKQGASAMLGVKGKTKANVLTRQQVAKAKDEAARKKVSDTIEGIYSKTKLKVEEKLNGLETEVNSIFDAGTEAALSQMKSFVEDRILRYKLERYLSIPIVGAARWIRDQFMGLPDEVNAFYVEGKNLFTSKMDALVVRVAALVEKRLAEAKQLVADGQNEIKTYVNSLPANLRSVGQAAQKEMESRFAELERGIEDKKNQLAQGLAQKYKEAQDKADKALKEIQDSNKGLVQAFVEKLGEIIKMLLEFKEKLMAILRKGADAIKLILADPIGFLGNLIAAIKLGFNQFKANIKTWLIKGLMGWLFGALAEAGVTAPADFSLPSILKLVLQILGITYERMRAKAVKLLGPTAVTIIEKLVEYVRGLITGGPAKLWEMVKTDLANLEEMVLGAIRDMIIESVVKAAIAKIVSMFNPVGAIVQAVLAIYNTVMFVVEQASRIMAFVESVVNSISDIANGAISGAANRVEQAFGNAIPIVIGFLARLIGLGDIPQRATAVVKKVQDIIDKAIDKAIGKLIGLIKKLFGKLTGRPKDEARTEAEMKQDVHKAAQEAQSAGRSKLSWVKLKLKLRSIKSKYKLTELDVHGGGRGAKSVEVTAKINPDEKVSVPLGEGGAKEVVQEAKQDAAQVDTLVNDGKTAAQTMTSAKTPKGRAYEQQRREELATRTGVTPIATQIGKNPQGFDTAFFVGQSTLELSEIKEGSSLTVFQAQAAGKGINVRQGTQTIPITGTGSSGADVSAAAAHLRQNPQDYARLAAGAKIIQERPSDEVGKTEKVKMDNKLSALTNNLNRSINKMYTAIKAAAQDPTLADATISKIGELLANESATVRFVLDIQKGVTMSVTEREVARNLIQASFNGLKAANDAIKAGIDMVLRTVDEKGNIVDEKL